MTQNDDRAKCISPVVVPVLTKYVACREFRVEIWREQAGVP
jgi:hypothetical protein